MKRVLNALLVTALVAPLLLLTGCCCPSPCEKPCEKPCKDVCDPCPDKCSGNYK